MVFEREDAHKAVAGQIKVRVVPRPRSGRAIYQVGQSYGVQGRTAGQGRQPGLSRVLGKVQVVATENVLLHEVDEDTAKAGGYATTQELHAYWRRMYRTGPGVGDTVVEVPVIVVRFVPDKAAESRFLRPGPRGGYTEAPSQAMRDEPECVPEAYQLQLARAARAHDMATREERVTLPHMSRPERLAELERLATASGLDMRSIYAAIDRRITEGLRKTAAAA